MGESRQKLTDSIQRVCTLCSGPPVTNETLYDEAWAALKTGIVVARKDLDALDAHSETEMHRILEFLVQRGIKRKASKGQVNECLKILLARQRWLHSARKDADLLAGLRDALSGSTELQEKLDAAAASQGRDRRRSAQGSDAGEKPTIKQQLVHGYRVMKSFSWEFPHDPLGTKLDEATAGFQSFHDGITALTTPTGRASVGADLSACFTEFEGDWKNLMHFLLSMYNSGVRTTYTLRIKFTVVNLRSFAPAFRSLMPWESLPWGSEPMPEDEAREQEEQRLAKEEKEARRKQREEEDFRLACELQAKEEAQVQAEEEVRMRRLQEDWQLAFDLQESLDAKLPGQRSGSLGA